MQPNLSAQPDPTPIDLYRVKEIGSDQQNSESLLRTNSTIHLAHAPSARTLSPSRIGRSSGSNFKARRNISRESRTSCDTSPERRRDTSRESRAARTASNESCVTRSASNESGRSSGRGSPASRQNHRLSRESPLAALPSARHLVSGNRNRFIDEQFDLDLTYITSRLIAMAFPGEDMLGAFSAVIRNNIRQVACCPLLSQKVKRRAPNYAPCDARNATARH